MNNLPKVVAQQGHGRASNPRLLDRKSDALPLSHRATPSNIVTLKFNLGTMCTLLNLHTRVYHFAADRMVHSGVILSVPRNKHLTFDENVANKCVSKTQTRHAGGGFTLLGRGLLSRDLHF